MIDYKEELKFNKQEKNRIKAEINDLESRIVVESGRHHRYEVNNYRDRVNRLKMRLNEVSLKIVELEKKIKESESLGQIQVISNIDLDRPSISNGEIIVTDEIEFDRGFSDIKGDVVQTVYRNIERTITYKNGKPVSSKETITETIKTQTLRNTNQDFIETTIVH